MTPLGLVADQLMRPARLGVGRLRSGVVSLVNLHPGCHGSALETLELAAAARSLGLGVMVGDDSLIGPGCAFWQQLAIGVGASCVEAVEKPRECDAFAAAVLRPATRLLDDGLCHLSHREPGTGLLIDVAAFDARVRSKIQAG